MAAQLAAAGSIGADRRRRARRARNRIFDRRDGPFAERSRRRNERVAGRSRHFVRRSNPGGDPKGFAQRRLFGRYLQAYLDEAIASGLSSWSRIARLRPNPVARVDTRLASGGRSRPPALVLANGNQAPEPLRVLERRASGSSTIRGARRRPRRLPKWRRRRRRAAGRDRADDGRSVLSLDEAGHRGGSSRCRGGDRCHGRMAA